MSSPLESRLFRYVVKVVPCAAGPLFGEVGGAFAHIWVLDSSLDVGRTRATAWLTDQGWISVELQSEHDSRDLQMDGLDAAETACLRRALSRGLWAYLVGWPATPEEKKSVAIRLVAEPTLPPLPQE